MDEKELRRRRQEIEKIAKAQAAISSASALSHPQPRSEVETKPRGCTPSFGFLIKWLIALGFASWTAYLVLALLLLVLAVVLSCVMAILAGMPFFALILEAP